MFLTSPQHPRIYNLPEAREELWSELDRARRMIEEFGRALEFATSPDQVMTGSLPLADALTPYRCLLLACIGRHSALGVTATRIARLMGTPRTLVDYHLDKLQSQSLIYRDPGIRYDRRKVVIRLTWQGGEALALASRVWENFRGTHGRRELAAESADADRAGADPGLADPA